MTPLLLADAEYIWTCGDLVLFANNGGVAISYTINPRHGAVTKTFSTYRGVTATGSDGQTYKAFATLFERLPTTDDLRRYRIDFRWTFTGPEGYVGNWRFLAKYEPGIPIAVTASGSCESIEP